jgi:hypothetical protein
MILLASQEAFQRPVGCRVLGITAYVTALMDREIDVLVTRPAPRRPGVLSTGVLAEPRMLLVPRRWPEADAATLTTAEAAALPLVYNPAMSPGDNGVWALGDVRPLREARLVPSHGSHFAETLPDLISGAGAMTIAPPLDELLPTAHARPVALPDVPPVQTAVCWRADGSPDDQLLAAEPTLSQYWAAASVLAITTWCATRSQRSSLGLANAWPPRRDHCSSDQACHERYRDRDTSQSSARPDLRLHVQSLLPLVAQTGTDTSISS